MGCGGSKDTGAGVDEQTFMFLSKVKLLKRLPSEELPSLASKATFADFKAGQTIITQGDEGNEFFMIKIGMADVEINEKKVAELKAGDYFGENALLRNEPRTATIKAVQDVKALKITREAFNSLELASKLEFPKRGAVGGGIPEAAEVKPPSPKTTEEIALINKALKTNANLNTIVHLDESKITAITDYMWKEAIEAGTSIIRQSDLNADYFYVVQSGNFTVSKAEAQQNVTDAVGVGHVGPGGSFGELALLYFAPRAATITAKENAIVWVTARQHFKEILAKANEAETSAHLKHINHCEVFASLKDHEKKELAQTMKDMTWSQNETIFDQDEKGTQFYMLIQGRVSVIKDGKEVASLEATDDKAQYFGEKALMEDEPRAATIKVTSTTARALWIDKETFDIQLGFFAELIKRGKDGTTQVQKKAAASASDSKRFGNIKFKDLKKLGLLGCGGFGAVEMVEHQESKETYALKGLSKGYVIKSGMQKSVMSEKDVQLMCDSPFIIMLYETFNSTEHLYLLLELALGGELYATYNKKSFWGKVDHAKFYVAGTLFAFEHMHSKKIVFRDLKPENLLLTDEGKVKITDMGLAKVVLGKTHTTCGTPDYFAPELIASKGHDHAVDWWTLGILTFELMSGHPPFESASPMQIYQKVQKGIHKVNFPAKLKGDVETLVKGLCNASPTERLPMKKGGVANVKSAKWFAGFSWEDMSNLIMVPPYKPPVKTKKDMANFSARKEDMPPQIPYKDPKTGWDKNFATSS